MTIDQIAQHLKEQAGVTKKQGEDCYNALIGLIKIEANKEQNTTVTLPKFGKLTVKYKDAYMGRNPRTGEPLEVKPMRKATFSAFDAFKQSLNETVK